MTFLSQPRRGSSPPIPEHLGPDVTLAQKKRLAMLAKMGIGPVAQKKQEAAPEPPPPPPMVEEKVEVPRGPSPQRDRERRLAMLERERRIREQEERQREQEEQDAKDEREKRKRPRAGLMSLGPVQAREERAAPAAPAAFGAQAGGPAHPPPRMDLKISAETAERARASSAPAAPREEDDEDDGDEAEEPNEDAAPAEVLDEMEALRLIRQQGSYRERAAGGGRWDRREPDGEARQKAKKKNKPKKSKDDEASAAPAEQAEDWDEDDPDVWPGTEQKTVATRPDDPKTATGQQMTRRESGVSYKKMVIESVKGKVSHAYKGFTDADLERRFGARMEASSSALMSEEEALAMINKEKKEKGSHLPAASRRVQREAAEWASAKQLRVARSRSRERLVVSGRK